METTAGAEVLHSPAARPLLRRRTVLLLAVTLLGAGAGGAFLLLDRDDRYPDEWDPRVVALVAFVEDERGLDFHHPVETLFLDDEAFRDLLEVDADALTDEERAEMKQFIALTRAMGLIEGEPDVLGALNRLGGETTLAFYDPEEERIVVRGRELDVATRVTLVHELTHALQDQHFDVGPKLDDGSSAFSALVEGDATVVEEMYVATLTASEREQYDDVTATFGENIDLTDVPEIFAAFQAIPYVFGPGLVTALLEDGGQRRLDQAFRETPTSDTHLLEPMTFLGGETPMLLPTPTLGRGEKRLRGDEDDHFGALGWFMVLAERIDPHDALAAVDGLSADVAIAFERDGRLCGRLAFSGATPQDTVEMQRALTRWVEEMPGGRASSRRDGDVVTLTSCDPGTEAKATTGRAVNAFALPAARSAIYRSIIDEAGVPSEVAWCSAAAIVERFSLETLTSDEPPTPDEEQVIGEAVLGCLGA